MNYDNMELPDKLRFTPLQMKLFEIVHISHDKPEIKEKAMEAINMVEKMNKDASNWVQVFFNIANTIN